MSIRINKYISDSGEVSRRAADKLIEQGKVRINEVVATLGSKVEPGDLVTLDGVIIKPIKDKTYLAFHKPVGVICTTDRSKKDNIIDVIDYPERVYPIGRLDVESSGLILLTNDGAFAKSILDPKRKIEKEYLVRVNKKLTAAFLASMRNGVDIGGYVTLPAKVRKKTDKSFSITITEGKNRQIRRMCEALGYAVTALKRTRIGRFSLGRLPIGSYLPILPSEVV